MKSSASSKRRLTSTRLRLYDAIEGLAHARAEASFLNGYRAAGKDTKDVRTSEKQTWEAIRDHLRPELDRAVRAYASALRQAERRGAGRRK